MNTTLRKTVLAWKSRWGIEVIHRYVKQNLGAGKCQCTDIQAHKNWIFCVLKAFNCILGVRKDYPKLSWREAQNMAASLFVKTDIFRDLTTDKAM